jgi:steroid 5-alpha reductase family enzyme
MPWIRARYVDGFKNVALPTSLSAFHPRQTIMTALTLVWAARLGSFLFQRIRKSGTDTRFDEIKQSPPKFFGAWMMQATWIAITALPVYLVNSIPKASQPPLGTRDLLGLAIWIAGMGLEVAADRQKSQWRQDRDAGKHNEPFISSGVWSWSRHPNYFGEVSLWTGQFVLATTALANAGTFYPTWAVGLAALSPLLEYGLIRFISGVPLLEQSAEKKHKDNPQWKKYKNEVPCFVPFVGSKN